MLQRAANNAYSWWWASHIRTKQSKWMEQNLQEMEEKVQVVLKLIEEDGDSFARRAEMYYKKRPELISFVEESYRAYRALAERYDKISKDLQNANNTIATVFPEQVQFSTEEEDEEALRKMPKKIPPSAVKPNVPKVPTKDFKGVLTSSAKKFQPKKTTNEAASPKVVKSGLTKPEALQEIDKLQKQTLTLQTEKEFVKSSYDHGLARFWEIEEQIKELQGKVCNLQDEFGEGHVIEDNEARHVMAEAALKSCQETLAQLQEKQGKSAEEAKVESERIKEAREKLKSLKGEFNYDQNKSEESCSNSEKEMEESKLIDGEWGREELQKLHEKIKQHFDLEFSKPVTSSEMVEKIDELVSKVTSLETAVSSQTAMVTRLRTETDELQGQIKVLEDDKTTLINDKNNLNNKLKEMEEKLHGVQDLNETLLKQNHDLQTQITEASCNLDHLYQKVESVKQDEEVEAKTTSQKEENPLVEGTVTDGLQGEFTEIDTDHTRNLDVAKSIEDSQVSGPDENQSKEQETANSSGYGSDKARTNVCPPDEEENVGWSQKSNDTNGVPLSGQVLESNESVVRNNADQDVKSQETGVEKIPSETVEERPQDSSQDKENAEEDEPDWKQLFLNELQDKERVLLAEYTTTLRNYKDVKKKLNEVDKKTQDDLSEISSQLKELKIANALKDEEIKLLRQRLNLMQRSFHGRDDLKEFKAVGHAQNTSLFNESTIERRNSSAAGKVTAVLADGSGESLIYQPDSISAMEGKFRTDIDLLLEENLDFWLKFSTSFHQIQKFETEIQDLQGEIEKLVKKKKSESGDTEKYSLRSDARPLYKHLMEIQTSLMVWLEKSTTLKEGVKSRFASLCKIQEEIIKAVKESAEDDDFRFTSYQSAKFQGEILNMRQENNKVADELQAGIDRVKSLQTEVQKSLAKLNDEFDLEGPKKQQTPQLRSSQSRSHVPLRSFIFGDKPKREGHSFFAVYRKYHALK